MGVQPTRRYWEHVALACSLIAAALVFDRPLLLVGSAGLFAWLVAAQAAFILAVVSFDRTLAVEHRLTEQTTLVDEPTTLVLGIEGDTHRLSVSATPRPAPGIAVDELPTVAPGETVAAAVSGQIVGTHAFSAPQLTIRGAGGLFETTLSRGPERELVIEAREPGRIHVGTGGDTASSTFGAHAAGSGASGLVPAELREYVENDPASRIDWNATARLAETYVRETEGETDRQTFLVVDHRRSMAVGREGERLLDYAREVGIGITHTALDRADPIGLWTVGERGPTASVAPGSATRIYGRIETLLYGLTPTEGGDARATYAAARARALADRLDGDSSRFAHTLSAYMGTADSYVTLLRDAPLVGTVERIRNQSGREGLIVLVTSDENPTELREAVKAAIRGGGRTLVFLLPRCLFEPTGLTDLDTAYERYRAFERLRRELDRHSRVTVYELAPDTRLNAVLEHRRAAQGVSQ